MITIDLLKNHPDAVPSLAKLWYDLLGHFFAPNLPVKSVEGRFQDHLNSTELPITLVALDEGTPVGMCSLREYDGIRPDLVPWLGSLVVHPDFQKQGIGKLLIDATKKQAQAMGFQKLYLFTIQPTKSHYYERLGWTKIGGDQFEGHPATVMEIAL